MLIIAKVVTVTAALALMIGQLFGTVSEQMRSLLDLLAIAGIAGAMFVYSRAKGALTVSESSSKSWQSEAAAQKERADRNSAELAAAKLAQTELIAKVAALEQRPDLTRLEHLISEGTEAMKHHEVAAGERTDRLIEILEQRLPTQEAA